MTATVRPAAPADLPLLSDIEQSGEALFAAHGIVFPPGPATIEAAFGDADEILVIGDPPLGFAAVVDIDGHPHLEQISVHSDHGHQGLGSLLLAEVLRQSGAGLTLLTFRDIPWNGPWYARHGFVELPETDFGPALRAKWRAEIDAGLHALAPRLAMHQP